LAAGLPAEMAVEAGREAIGMMVTALESGKGSAAAARALDAIRGRVGRQGLSQAMKRRFVV